MTEIHERTPTVLLIDDQALIGEAVRRMLSAEKDIKYHFCNDPTKAIAMAKELSPTVILQDLVMPQIDGLTLVRQFREDEATKNIPLIVLSTKEEPTVKAESFALGANDYLVKLPDKIELVARIRYHSQGYISLLERNEAYIALEASQKALANELAKASDYVLSLLPQPITEPFGIDWRYVPSMQLGGDIFGYHWLDKDNLAVYLLDVCGHGVGAALLSVSAINVLRSRSLPDIDFMKPEQVLDGLNKAFQMEDHNYMFFTIWYGVYNKSEKKLICSSGGHPPAMLIRKSEKTEVSGSGPAIGSCEEAVFKSNTFNISEKDRLYIYSDGVFEILKPDGNMWSMHEFIDNLSLPAESGNPKVEQILITARQIGGKDIFEDDFSLIEITF